MIVSGILVQKQNQGWELKKKMWKRRVKFPDFGGVFFPREKMEGNRRETNTVS